MNGSRQHAYNAEHVDGPPAALRAKRGSNATKRKRWPGSLIIKLNEHALIQLMPPNRRGLNLRSKGAALWYFLWFHEFKGEPCRKTDIVAAFVAHWQLSATGRFTSGKSPTTGETHTAAKRARQEALKQMQLLLDEMHFVVVQ